MSDHPSLTVAVTLRRLKDPSPWEEWRFEIADVALDDGGFGAEPRVLRDDERSQLMLFPGFPVTLFADEAEGYYLNVTSGKPVWFVMWRVDDVDPSRAWPERVTLSYNEAGRLLDAQERVDIVPLPHAVRQELQTFTDQHYRPEPKRRRRPASFQPPENR